MRRFFAILSVLGVLAVSASCSKEGPSLFEGNYSFKTSGTITVRQTGVEDAETIDLSLNTEMGQMDVIRKGDDRMLVSMNVMGGDLLTFDACASGDSLKLDPSGRKIRITHIDSGVFQGDAVVTGSAVKYDDVIVFEFSYSGTCEKAGITYDIVDSDVKCVAKSNK